MHKYFCSILYHCKNCLVDLTNTGIIVKAIPSPFHPKCVIVWDETSKSCLVNYLTHIVCDYLMQTNSKHHTVFNTNKLSD